MFLLLTSLPCFFLNSKKSYMILLNMPIIIFISKTEHQKFFSINFMMDSMTSLMIILTLWVTLSLLIMSKENIMNLTLYFLLISLTFMFMSTKLISFYIFYELTLVPSVILILGWGYQPERLEASLYMFLYTLFFSLPLLAIIIFMSSININYLTMNYMNFYTLNPLLSLLIILSFLSKLPGFLFHIWLPKAHVEAPMEGSIMLASILLKMSGYGMMRFMKFLNLGMTKNYLIMLSAIGMTMSAAATLMMMDMKMTIAYSSVSHMNFLMLGFLSESKTGEECILMIMLAHGLISPLLFFLADLNYKIFSSRSLLVNKFMFLKCMIMSLMWLISLIMNSSFPPMILMLSELMISSLFLNKTFFIILLIILYLLITGIYNMNLFLSISHGYLEPHQLILTPSLKIKSMLIITMWMIPFLFLIFSIPFNSM
uniref:NADH dehydrogenase subunit 4 n=1 Tax=Laemobothrion maximum TaxID=2337902 RepID=UPI00257BBCC6|nr:NADH dehydrogenase subunit 4 [Laemobothrion maximum]WGU50336.1 NADH dehydrogenase subunit 4 [Laemobothrion maximum]